MTAVGWPCYAVDRLEGRGVRRTVVLVGDDGAVREVPWAAFREPVAEGWVLRVPLPAGEPAWGEAVRDVAEEERRRVEALRRLKGMRRGDAGGDLAL